MPAPLKIVFFLIGFLCIHTLFVITPLHARQSSSQETVESFQILEMKALMDAGAWEKAVAQGNEILREQRSGSGNFRMKVHVWIVKSLNQAERYEEALHESEKIDRLYKQSLEQHPSFLREFYFQRAYTYSGLHNQKYEIAYMQKTLKVMEDRPDLFSMFDFIQTYNDLYYYQLNYEDKEGLNLTYGKYIAFFRRKSTAFTAENYGFARRVRRKMEVTLALYQHRPERATNLLNQFLAEVEKPFTTHDQAYLNSCYSHINNYYYFAKAYDQAIRFGEEYLAFARKTQSSFDTMLAYSKIGTSYEQLGNYDEAIRYIDLSMNAFEFGEFSASLFALQIIKAKCLSGKKQHAAAAQLAENTIERIVSYKLKKPTAIMAYPIEQLTDLNSNNYINIFASAGLILLEKYKQLGTKSDLIKAEKILKTSTAMFREFYLKGEFNATLYHLHNKNAEGLLYIAFERYRHQPNALIHLLNLIEENASKHLYRSYQQKAGTNQEKGKAVGITEDNFNRLIPSVQETIGEDEEVLKYYVLPKDIYRIRMTRHSVDLDRLANSRRIQSSLLEFVKEVGEVKLNYKTNGKKLARLLLPEKLSAQVTIISDNFLNYLPFEALTDPVSGKFLVEKHAFSYAYSLAILHWNRFSGNPMSSKKALVLNPYYPEGSIYEGFSTPPLPFSQKETQEIARTMDAVVIGEQVRKTDFTRRADDHGVYHFAMHAYLDENDFRKSCLLFSGNEPLFFEELYQMHIPADMVVLAACNTGNGRIKNGEGIMSLSMAFTFAGTRSGIYSLWKVPDAETAGILSTFYKNLKKGLSKDAALALAKRDFIREHPLKSHPFFWAGFIVSGDTSPLFEPSQPSWLIWVLMLIPVSVLLVFLRKKTGI